MADRLTQLQDALDQLATQFYASVRYVTTHHPRAPQHHGGGSTSAPQTPAHTDGADPFSAGFAPPRPDTPIAFAAAQRELARDLILKEQQIEYLISVLPGIGTSENEQKERIRELEDELREAERERREVGKEREELIERVEGVIMKGWGKRGG
ncbi:MAG: hypothetical protein M4579_001688 [Chaenotheca gracillima]|nr:MAG: hypothetical protein M4579_001688 [Chaenotheca gracillima]